MELLKGMAPALRLPLRHRLITITTRDTLLQQSIRSLSTTPNTSATGPSTFSGLTTLAANMRASQTPSGQQQQQQQQQQPSGPLSTADERIAGYEPQNWHLHVYSHKHNTHLTLSRPNRNAVISLSTGQIGFRKAQRGTYDAAYQLGAYLMARIERAGFVGQIDSLELVFRGFGQGREAIGKIMTGSEGSALRSKVVKVVDSTRLKFGGTRSKKPRRLG